MKLCFFYNLSFNNKQLKNGAFHIIVLVQKNPCMYKLQFNNLAS